MNVTEVVKERDVEEVKQVQVDVKVAVKDLEAKTVIEEKGVDPYPLNQNIWKFMIGGKNLNNRKGYVLNEWKHLQQ